MGLAQNADALEPPTLKIAGLEVWVQGYESPDSEDPFHSDWLIVTAHCGANGASVWASGAILMASDFARWLAECEILYRDWQGEAVLASYEPNLHVCLRPEGRLGHLHMCVKITPDHMCQKHEFDFEIDQSYLPSLLGQCRSIVQKYPARY